METNILERHQKKEFRVIWREMVVTFWSCIAIFGEIVDVYRGNSKTALVTGASTQYADLVHTIRINNSKSNWKEKKLSGLQQQISHFKIYALAVRARAKFPIWEVSSGTRWIM